MGLKSLIQNIAFTDKVTHKEFALKAIDKKVE